MERSAGAALEAAHEAGLNDYFNLYNYERPHQSLQDLTPAVVYQKGLLSVG